MDRIRASEEIFKPRPYQCKFIIFINLCGKNICFYYN